ncbi:1-acyl-sn-glycerol-3-phosphate acyltransferase [uncultured Paracoccus sp.]|uniref:1-acyl-sn-glycerol-3-phosphate acyltransferase n=1 Tax=uncultured Paracoccus sp. TaxID=189685 RepID=UPI00262BADA6|nr:1-acyl-sn-glycerol-3-phosphate acyltransferase [uncultured Paracoccus sp.]
MTTNLSVRMARAGLVGTARALLSLRAIDLPPATDAPRILVANHVSHADFIALWSVLPHDRRLRTRPVAGAGQHRR